MVRLRRSLSTRRRGGLLILGAAVLIAFCSYRAVASSHVYYWSKASTWGGHLPQAGDHIVIPKGKVIVLDVSPPPLASIDVRGTLAFADNRDINLVVGDIAVHGLLQVGTHESPYRGRANITLTCDGGGMKMIHVVEGGTLEMHGVRPAIDWQHLAQTAMAGATSIRTERPANWKAGDHVVIASTDFDPHQAEEVTITGEHGDTVEFSPPLKYMHFGEILRSGVDERAEVGLLTRNIVVQGDDMSDADGMGGEIMITDGGRTHLEAVELTRMGKLGEKGHYPIHFHLVGEGAGMYVEDCALHHCYNRCITVHGTRDVLVNSNVAYDTIGHCYFLEDGNEIRNVLTNNLGVLTKKAEMGHQVLDSDLSPSTFWVTNPNNVLRGNVAAGSDRFGFWYALPKHPTGFAATPENAKSVWNRRTPLGEFRDNVSHSNDDSGLFVDPGPNPPGVYEAPTYDPKVNQIPASGPEQPATAYFANFTGYKNRKRGIWLRGSYLNVVGAKLADNATGATLACSHSSLMNSVIVGESNNVGTPAAGDPVGEGGRSLPKPYAPKTAICGFELYDGPISGQGIRFENFQPTRQREASALGYLRFTPYYVDFRNSVSNLTFVNSKKVFLANLQIASENFSGDGYRSAVFLDKDGCVTGTPGTYVAAKDALLVDDADSYVPEWNAYLCHGPFARLFIEDRDPQPVRMSPISLNRDDLPNKVFRMWGVPSEEFKNNISFQTTILPNRFFRLAIRGKTPHTMRFTLRSENPNQWTMVRIPIENPRYAQVSFDQGDTHPLLFEANPAILKSSPDAGYCIEKKSIVVKLVSAEGYGGQQGVAYVTTTPTPKAR